MSEPFRTTLPRSYQGPPDDGSPAWEAAFKLNYVDLCEYVLRFVGSAEAAEELVQELFLHLWETGGRDDASRLSRPYLYVAARNRALKYLRHRRVAQAWVDRVSREEPPASDTPEDACLRAELEAVIERAIAELPDRCRAIFLLRRRELLSYDDIAKRSGVSLGTVKTQMWRATSQLREKLAPYLASYSRPAEGL
jgi:RNA polymerase sigma-70 factor (ECF subfamily)